MYHSNADDKIFQEQPPEWKPSAHKLKSWTDTIQGYLNEAKKLTHCLLENRKLARQPYTWFVTIYMDVVMQPKEINDWWKKSVRNLQRKGVIAIWVREPTRTNKVHYHLILRSHHSKDELIRIIEQSLPSRQLGRWHKNVEQIEGSDWRLLHYFTKAKCGGYTESGKYVADLYAKKRLLFKSGLGIRKVGTIGPFWVKRREEIWQKVKDTEKRIAEGLADERVRKLAKHAHELINGYYSLKQIERNFGADAQSPVIQNWIASLNEDENRAEGKRLDSQRFMTL